MLECRPGWRNGPPRGFEAVRTALSNIRIFLCLHCAVQARLEAGNQNAKYLAKSCLTSVPLGAFNVSRLSGRGLLLTQLKRLSTKIPKNGESGFSSSIPRRKPGHFDALARVFALRQMDRSRGIAGVLRSAPAWKVSKAGTRNPADKKAGGLHQRNRLEVTEKTGGRMGIARGKWIFLLTIYDPRDSNGSVAVQDVQVNRCI